VSTVCPPPRLQVQSLVMVPGRGRQCPLAAMAAGDAVHLLAPREEEGGEGPQPHQLHSVYGHPVTCLDADAAQVAFGVKRAGGAAHDGGNQVGSGASSGPLQGLFRAPSGTHQGLCFRASSGTLLQGPFKASSGPLQGLCFRAPLRPLQGLCFRAPSGPLQGLCFRAPLGPLLQGLFRDSALRPLQGPFKASSGLLLQGLFRASSGPL